MNCFIFSHQTTPHPLLVSEDYAWSFGLVAAVLTLEPTTKLAGVDLD
jgi:hypothetical protein